MLYDSHILIKYHIPFKNFVVASPKSILFYCKKALNYDFYSSDQRLDSTIPRPNLL